MDKHRMLVSFGLSAIGGFCFAMAIKTALAGDEGQAIEVVEASNEAIEYANAVLAHYASGVN